MSGEKGGKALKEEYDNLIQQLKANWLTIHEENVELYIMYEVKNRWELTNEAHDPFLKFKKQLDQYKEKVVQREQQVRSNELKDLLNTAIQQ